VRFERCRLGHVLSPKASTDSYLTFRSNNMEGYDLNLQHPDGMLAKDVVIENNYLRNLTITNSRSVNVYRNRVSNLNSYAQDFVINKSTNVHISNNRIRRLIMKNDTDILVLKNDFYYQGMEYSRESPLIYSEYTHKLEIISNQIFKYHYYHGYSRGVELLDCSSLLISDNDIKLKQRDGKMVIILGFMQGVPIKKI